MEHRPNYVNQRLRKSFGRKTNHPKLSLVTKPRPVGSRKRGKKTLSQISNYLVKDVKRFEEERFVEAPNHSDVKIEREIEHTPSRSRGFRLPGMHPGVVERNDNGGIRRGVKNFVNQYDRSKKSNIPTRPIRPKRPPHHSKRNVNITPQRPPPNKRPKSEPSTRNTKEGQVNDKEPPKRPPRRPSRRPNSTRKIGNNGNSNIRLQPPEIKEERIISGQPRAKKKLGGVAAMFESGGAFNKKVVKKTMEEESIPKFENSFFADAKRRREEARRRKEEQMRIEEEEERKRLEQQQEEEVEGEVVQVTTEYLQDLLMKFNNLNEDRMGLHNENEEMKGTLNDLKEKLESSNALSSSRKQRNLELEASIRRLEKSIEDVKSKNRHLSNSTKIQSQKFKESEKKIEKLSTEKMQLQKKLEEASKKMKQIQKEKSSTSKSLRSQQQQQRQREEEEERMKVKQEMKSVNSRNEELLEKIRKLEVSRKTELEKHKLDEWERQKKEIHELQQQHKKEMLNIQKKGEAAMLILSSSLKTDLKKKRSEEIETLKRKHREEIKKMEVEFNELLKTTANRSKTTSISGAASKKKNSSKDSKGSGISFDVNTVDWDTFLEEKEEEQEEQESDSNRLEQEVRELRRSNSIKQEKIEELESRMKMMRDHHQGRQQQHTFLEDDRNKKLEFLEIQKKLNEMERERKLRVRAKNVKINGTKKGVFSRPSIQGTREEKKSFFGLCF